MLFQFIKQPSEAYNKKSQTSKQLIMICHRNLEKDLEIVADWLKHNRLLLNFKKSNAMIFKWKYQRQTSKLDP